MRLFRVCVCVVQIFFKFIFISFYYRQREYTRVLVFRFAFLFYFSFVLLIDPPNGIDLRLRAPFYFLSSAQEKFLKHILYS